MEQMQHKGESLAASPSMDAVTMVTLLGDILRLCVSLFTFMHVNLLTFQGLRNV